MDRVTKLRTALDHLSALAEITGRSDERARNVAGCVSRAISAATGDSAEHDVATAIAANKDSALEIVSLALATIPRTVASSLRAAASASQPQQQIELALAAAVGVASATKIVADTARKSLGEKASASTTDSFAFEAARVVTALLRMAVATSRAELSRAALDGALRGSPQKFILRFNAIAVAWRVQQQQQQQQQRNRGADSNDVLPAAALWQGFFVDVVDEVARRAAERLLNDMMATGSGVSAQEGSSSSSSPTAKPADSTGLRPLDAASRMGAESVAKFASEQAAAFCEQWRGDVGASLSVGSLTNVATLFDLVRAV